MKDNYVVHFGAGALGRGLVVPMLYESNKQIVLVDTDQKLISALKNKKSYKLRISDDDRNPVKIIAIKDIISPVENVDKLIEYLKRCDIVTTSVRKENLTHIVNVIVKAWGHEVCNDKIIICCENIEGVGDYFKKILMRNASEEEFNNIKNIKIPNTIVDRICAVGEDIEDITSEQFHECSVDVFTVQNTGLKMIPAVDNITSHFYRKRYLLNTYADAMAYIGKKKGYTYLYEATRDEDIQNKIGPYIELLKKLLFITYGIDEDESQKWFELYKKRLSNDAIKRNLDTVARNLWDKLGVHERFVCPLLELMKNGIDIKTGIPVLYEIVFSQNLSKSEIYDKLCNLWSNDKEGKGLLEYCKEEWKL